MLLALLAGARVAGAQSTTRPAAAQPADVRAFQPGVGIDWQRREVHVHTRVVLRAGTLEFLACWPGKEHESIVRCEAAATHVYLALGLIGLSPGHPPTWDPVTETYGDPAGDLLDIAFTWEQDGGTHAVDAYAWLREVEYQRPAIPRPWVFAGSVRLPEGTLSSDHSGVGVALVDFPDSLVCYPRRQPSCTSELWACANTEAIPPLGTPVRMVLRPAAVRARTMKMDFRGQLWVDQRWTSAADAVDLTRCARLLDPGYVQTVSAERALRGDLDRFRAALRAVGLPVEAVRLTPAAPGRDD